MNTDDTHHDGGGARADHGGTPMRLRLRDPADLLAAVPHLIGFRPADSLVLAAVVPARRGGGRELGAVLRTDLPAPPDVAALVAACARRLGETRPDEVALLVVGGGEPVGACPPRPDVVAEAVAVLELARVPVRLRLWTPRVASGETWRCYPPCDCAGVIGPVEDSPTAVASTLMGRVTFSSRAELEASLAAEAGADGPRRRALVERARASAVLDRELAGRGAARRDVEALRHARREVAAGVPLTEDEVARLVVALADVTVRDACLGWALDDDPADVAQLWTALVRAAPSREVADAAVLLALTLLVRGGGGLVGAALERARTADPAHRLTFLVESMLAHGLGREDIRTVVVESGREATAALAA